MTTISIQEQKEIMGKYNGWLSPEGKYYPCRSGVEWHLHEIEAENIVIDILHTFAENESLYLLDNGWIKIGNREIIFGGRGHDKITKAQLDGIFDYMIRNNFSDLYYEYENISFKKFIEKLQEHGEVEE